MARARTGGSVASMLTATVTPLSSLPTAHPASTAQSAGTSAIAKVLARANRAA